jgi:N-acetyl-gamma-glutamylphosphate reductase
MSSMFDKASSFNGDIRGWVSPLPAMPSVAYPSLLSQQISANNNVAYPGCFSKSSQRGCPPFVAFI